VYINNICEASGMNSSIHISMLQECKGYKLTYHAETPICALPGIHKAGN